MNIPWRSWLDEPRVPAPPGTKGRDLVLVAVVAVCATLEVVFRDDLRLPWLSWLVTVGMSPTLLWRRSRPLAAVGAAFGVAIAVDVGLLVSDRSTLEMYSAIWFLALPYALLRWGSGRDVAAGLGLISVAAVLGIVVDSDAGLDEAVGGITVLLTAMAVGVAVRSQSAGRSRRLEQAKADERVLLARELHDTVAHHVSAIAIQAQAGRALAATDPQLSVRALEVIEHEASRTLAEMRAMVRVLRAGPADYAPQPGVRDLERLANGTSRLPVRVALTGALDDLPAALDAAVYRICQEAVTNAARHARNATSVTVRVDGGGSDVRVLVQDDGDATAVPADGQGFGITGMTERAALLGGSCRAGPDPHGGWTVEATLPREAPR